MSPSDEKNQLLSEEELRGTNPLFANSHLEPSEGLNWRSCFPEIVGRSPKMQNVLQTVAKVARSDISVLIHGESGTGKELIAAALHRLSLRASRRFVALNCGAIPEALLESELFGHEKGAFTGAHQRRHGRFEQADGGTLFLDEIGDMPPRLQVKLLRVLQEKQFDRIGGTETLTADVRVIAATNVDLARAVDEGHFRRDLYYRLNVLPIELPPLRERRDDISGLLQHFLANANRVNQLRGEECFFSEQVLQLLEGYHWPGNVRELQNLVERLVVMAQGGEIRTAHLPDEVLRERSPRTGLLSNCERQLPSPSFLGNYEDGYATNPAAAEARAPQASFLSGLGQLPSEGLNLSEFIEGLENSLILQALARTHNNKQQAAKLLGMNRTTLVERIKKRKIDVPQLAAGD